MRRTSMLLLALLLAATCIQASAAEAPREPMLYGLASLALPGLGQVLQGETTRGLTHFGLAVAVPFVGGSLAMLTPAPARNLLWTAVGAATLGVAVYSAIDSYELAVAYNRRHGFAIGLTLRV